ncbi:MFS transporter [Aeromicrobium phragmitis]|uniref:MFS transporter n=1 Tax=Aeromicrobium phragmitis TaxID=2478914 RepID=A0A3L8PPV9_9ACTN|nr:MFS transporter [Aeromicrobium phragmitis]RLV57407.1 MFS transporter [Aeromicrobium phragmitis]
MPNGNLRSPTDSLGGQFPLLLGSSATSNLADGIVKVALPLIAVQWTDSPVLVGGILAASTLPWLLFALPAGLLVDALDRRRAMMLANLLRASALALASISILVGEHSLWMLYATAFVLGSAETVHDTAAQSLLPSVVAPAALERANGRLSTAEVTTNGFAGPPLGGLLISVSAVLGVVIPAGLWIVALLALFALSVTPQARPVGPLRWRHELLGGIRFAWANTVLRTMAGMVALCNLATSAFLGSFVVYAVGPNSVLGATAFQYGLLMALAGVGSVLGALGAAKAASVMGRGRLLALSLLGMASFIGAPSIVPALSALTVTFLIGGAAVAVWNVVTVSFRQRITPDALLGRVNAIYRLLTWGTIPVGALLGGSIGSLVGLTELFALAAGAAIVSLVGLRWVNESSMAENELRA